MRLIVLNSHPIQYFIPLYQQISKEENIDLRVLFLSSHGANEYFDKDFNQSIKWDIPMLSGFKYDYITSNPETCSPNNGFWSLFSWNIIPLLIRSPKSVIIIHGWNYIINLVTIVFANLLGHKICIRSDIPLIREDIYYSKIKKILRYYIFKFLLFPWINYFLYIGEENKKFYLKYGVKENKLIFTPFSIDNSRFKNEHKRTKNKIRCELGLPTTKRIIIFSGKLIPIKQPMQLLKSFYNLDYDNSFLLFVGEGELRNEMEIFIQNYKMKNVCITGFINQSEIPKYYAASDIFVMCSTLDAWGLSVNEAMNFNLPLILSDRTGCASDLLKVGENGFSYVYNDDSDLMTKLKLLLDMPEAQIERMGKASGDIIQKYSYEKVIIGLKQIRC